MNEEKAQTEPLADHQRIHSSNSNEWYTPVRYIKAVHEVMGGVDLDPASCAYANQIIQATVYYTLETDGFNQAWPGRVFLNPPYGIDSKRQSNAGKWSKRLIDQFQAGITTEAILLVNAVPGNEWFKPLWQFLICFTDHRIKFYNSAGQANQPTHSNCFVYLGSNQDRFCTVFAEFGPVVQRICGATETVEQLPLF